MYFEPDLLEDFVSSYRVGTVCHLQAGIKAIWSLRAPHLPVCPIYLSVWPSGLRTGGAGQAVSQRVVTIAQYRGGTASASSLRWAFDPTDLGGRMDGQ